MLDQLISLLICILQHFKNTILLEENYRLIFDHSFEPNNQNKYRTKLIKTKRYISLLKKTVQ